VLLASLVVVAALAILARAAEASGATRAVLTVVEYRALTHEQAALKRDLAAKPVDWGAAHAACHAPATTALLEIETADCAANVAEVQAIFAVISAVAAEPKCAQQSGHSSSSCLLPAYVRLDTSSNKTLVADQAVYRVAAERGFSGTCLYTLASTPAQRADEQRFVRVMNETVAAMRTNNRSALATLAPQLTETMNAYLTAKAPTNLAVCKHQ
jgi:hypothetical protein